MSTLNRRRFLVGAGGVTVALPFLSIFGSKGYSADAQGPKRIIVMAYAMGTASGQWRPSREGAITANDLRKVTDPMAPFVDRSLFVSNIDFALSWEQRQHRAGHPGKRQMALTGSLMTSALGGDGDNHMRNVIADKNKAEEGLPGNASVEHVIGQHLKTDQHLFQDISLSIDATAGYHPPDNDTNFFFEGRETPVRMQGNPAMALHELFSGLNLDPAAEASLLELKRKNKSVLDAVRASHRDLRQKLSPSDRARLDDHTDRLRDIELEVQMITCSEPTGIPNDGSGNNGDLWEPYRDTTMRERMSAMRQILIQGMACDLAPVGRVEFPGMHAPAFGKPEIDSALASWNSAKSGSVWHNMVHGDVSPVDGKGTRDASAWTDGYAPYLIEGYRFFVEEFAAICADLDAIDEGPDGRTALDNTLLVLCSDYGEGTHHKSLKTNWLLAGNTGPSGKTGFHLDGGGDPTNWGGPTTDFNHNQLLCSILKMCGVTDANGDEIQEYGTRGFTSGIIPGLFNG